VELFFSTHTWHIVVTFAATLLYIVLNYALSRKVISSADHSNFDTDASDKARTVLRFLLGLLTLLVVCLVWGIKFKSILVFSTTMLTLLGVAMFAQWSLISNITAYFVLLFHPSIRRGSYVRIMDTDNFIEGYVSELNLFSAKLITENREIVVYPNNLMLSRPTIINPRVKFGAQGKIEITANTAKDNIRD